MSKKAVGWFVAILTIAIILFDVYLWLDPVADNTYSARITALSDDWFWTGHLIAGAMGLLAWHWFRNTATPGYDELNEPPKKMVWSHALLLLASSAFGMAIAELIGFH